MDKQKQTTRGLSKNYVNAMFCLSHVNRDLQCIVYEAWIWFDFTSEVRTIPSGGGLWNVQEGKTQFRSGQEASGDRLIFMPYLANIIIFNDTQPSNSDGVSRSYGQESSLNLTQTLKGRRMFWKAMHFEKRSRKMHSLRNLIPNECTDIQVNQIEN